MSITISNTFYVGPITVLHKVIFNKPYMGLEELQVLMDNILRGESFKEIQECEGTCVG